MSAPTPRERSKRTVGDRRRKGEQQASGWNSLFALGLGAVVLSFVVFVWAVTRDDSAATPTGTPDPGATSPGAATATPDGGSSASATPETTPFAELLPCGDILVPLDKEHRLSADCAPNDLQQLPGSLSEGAQYLRAEAAAAFKDLVDAASKDGFRLTTSSTYRSYANQEETFNYWVSRFGLAEAERQSARPGHSEHQLGTTADVCAPGRCLEAFTGSAEASWLANNAWKYGFVISYPEGKEAVTGYVHEPWHIRYLGKDIARQVKDSGLTLHEFLLR